jgi:hypothetical protein
MVGSVGATGTVAAGGWAVAGTARASTVIADATSDRRRERIGDFLPSILWHILHPSADFDENMAVLTLVAAERRL